MANFISRNRRGIEALYSGGASELQGNRAPRDAGFSPEPLPPEPYTSGSPYAQGAAQWDANGMPVGPMPRGQYALDWQYEANRRAEQKRQTLWGDSQNVLRQGADLLQSYRPGGSAALASGIHSQRAGLYASQAQNTQAPDLLIGYRDRQQQQADAERQQAERFARTMAIVQAGATVLGAGVGGGLGAVAANQAVGALGASAQPSGPTATQSPTYGGMFPSAYPGAQGAQGGGGGQLSGPGAQQSPTYGGMFPSSYGGAAGGGMPGGGGGASPGPSFTGGGDSGTSQAKSGDGGGGGGDPYGDSGANAQNQVQTDGPGPMTTFQSGEAAANSMAASKIAQMTVYPDWSDDPDRKASLQLQMSGARARLMAAMNYENQLAY